MAIENISTITADRLRQYELFSDETISAIAGFARKQARYKTYQDFFNDMGMPKPNYFIAKNGAGVPFVKISPTIKPLGTIVLHLPMANPLDENQLYHIATVVGTNPGYQVIAFGNPSGKPYSYKQQNLSLWQKVSIALTNKMKPLVAAELEYLQAQGVTQAHYVGYSYGAHKAMIESYYSEPASVKSITLIDPVAHPRGFKQLVHDFKNTFHPMGEYVNQTGLQTYFDARAAAAKTKHHDRALTRPINIAIGVILRRVDFIKMLEKVLKRQPGISATVAWGTESELTNDAHLKVSMHRLKYDSKQNVHPLRIKAGKHALGNDVYLYAAIIRQALSLT